MLWWFSFCCFWVYYPANVTCINTSSLRFVHLSLSSPNTHKPVPGSLWRLDAMSLNGGLGRRDSCPFSPEPNTLLKILKRRNNVYIGGICPSQTPWLKISYSIWACPPSVGVHVLLPKAAGLSFHVRVAPSPISFGHNIWAVVHLLSFLSVF